MKGRKVKGWPRIGGEISIQEEIATIVAAMARTSRGGCATEAELMEAGRVAMENLHRIKSRPASRGRRRGE